MERVSETNFLERINADTNTWIGRAFFSSSGQIAEEWTTYSVEDARIGTIQHGDWKTVLVLAPEDPDAGSYLECRLLIAHKDESEAWLSIVWHEHPDIPNEIRIVSGTPTPGRVSTAYRQYVQDTFRTTALDGGLVLLFLAHLMGWETP